jgi:hypothetical protein
MSNTSIIRAALSAALAAGALGIAACDQARLPTIAGAGGVTGASSTGIVLTPGRTQLSVGQSLTLVATADSSVGALNWSSSNPAVATVTSSGIVTGVTPGTVTITAAAQSNQSVNGSATIDVVSR